MTAVDLRLRLVDLRAERALAIGQGCAEDGLLLRSIDADLAAHRAAYVATAVTEIAILRRELGDAATG
jgi:hypothetical protein